MDGIVEHHKRSQSGSEGQKSHVLPHADYRPKTNAVILFLLFFSLFLYEYLSFSS
jgi:hypothetical protein